MEGHHPLLKNLSRTKVLIHQALLGVEDHLSRGETKVSQNCLVDCGQWWLIAIHHYAG
jgi:hypothetical protein